MKKWVTSLLIALFASVTILPTVSAASFWNNVDRQEQQKQENERLRREQQERERQEKERKERERQEQIKKRPPQKPQKPPQQQPPKLPQQPQRPPQQQPPKQPQRPPKHPQQRPQHSWNHPSYRNPQWRQDVRRDAPPFQWYEKRSRYSAPGYRMEPIYDRSWNDRFPGLRAYRWQDRPDRGFWYRGHRITDAVMFYDAFDDLVSVGFMYNGVFMFVRDDNNAFENRDSFFLTWWH
ncbi:hypothetical protein [Acetonema longum]|uniref:Uncharacterized protein n=1 Tax=Acetonema longum DSM 6540 TaxID=1009370 RepID=F7NQF3_9FIRM|nr:hypothetical protein [Acetonema longum]EGO61731.1 hypothetical protein ALO_21761 [Acetonema longum DSM 6540]